jgi:serine/threonine protein kinase/Flp pilus assembly protein TadD
MIDLQVSHYRILRKLGSGAMGVVYAAEDLKLGRPVALKFLSENLAKNPEALERFRREARAASALNHPNICTLYELGEHEGAPFLVLEMLEGETLKQRLTNGLKGDPLDLALQIASALEAAHAKGIVHRDIKPSNIFISEKGVAKIMDFGIAKAVTGSSEASATVGVSLTVSGMAVGSLKYMSPEQARGEEVDGRADVFSFGLVLAEMAAAGSPLQTIASRATERDRSLRYQTASDVRADLERLKRDNTPVPSAASVSASTVRQPSRRGARQKTRKELDSLAVLPFVNLGGDPDMEYLSEGITDTLINSISQLRKIRVVPRSLAFRYKGPHVDPQEAGRELQVDVVLTGRLSLRGETLVIGTELLNVAQSAQIGGAIYNRKLDDIFTIQEEIARQIFDKLKMHLSGDEKKRVNKRATENKEAYQLYLRGVYFLNRWSPEDLRRSTEYCLQAVAIDPAFAPAHAILAMAYCMLGVYVFAPANEVFPKGKAAALRAMELDESVPEAHGALATARLFYDWDWAGGEESCRRALELNSEYAVGHQVMAVCLIVAGKMEEALVEERRALELDPVSPAMNLVMGLNLFFARRWDAAAEQLQRAIEISPNPRAMILQAWSYAHAGRASEALAVQNKLNAASRSPRVRIIEGYTLAVLGKTEQAGEIFRSLVKAPPTDPASIYNLAGLAAALGENDVAFDCLEKVYAARFAQMLYLRVFPIFNRLHNDPRFEDLAWRIGLP